jgi:hypothetical protein
LVGSSSTQRGFPKDKIAKAMEWRHKVIDKIAKAMEWRQKVIFEE